MVQAFQTNFVVVSHLQPQTHPSFVGNDYFCESGQTTTSLSSTFFPNFEPSHGMGEGVWVQYMLRVQQPSMVHQDLSHHNQ